ncbi:MAG: aldehyde ferredoxin oxidoreductase C-terminal domain-containing protein [Planctomycetota bacterium]|nr:aldehyde ferredoxin oxidoreductase C-terminal domain-containing protein [Planctomycetota bacterium]
MITNGSSAIPSDFQIQQYRVDLNTQQVVPELVTCEDFEDVFGGMARGFKVLENTPVDDAYAPDAAMLMNLGILSGSDFMTGLRTYFNAYSPLKRALNGKPSAMWSTGSGKFGTKLRYLDVDEVLFTGRCAEPMYLRIFRDGDDQAPKFEFHSAAELVGLKVNARIQQLYAKYPNAHFATIGPAGDNYEKVRYAGIALSTVNQLTSGDPKPRWCGRGGMGGVLGSKNLLAIVADVEDPESTKAPAVMKELNSEIAKGKGSARFRDKKKGGGGGTWANYEALNPVHAMPEMNFVPTGTAVSLPLYRDNVESTDDFIVKDESCFRCGISCHKNVYDNENGKATNFRAKLDFEPLNLMASNIGIFDLDKACVLVELVDEMGMDSISFGTTLSYILEYNNRHPDNPVAGGVRYGEYENIHTLVEQTGRGELELVGQGSLRASEELQENGYAMHCKGVEFPAYLPQTNPGYPWALAGGHMSMKTYLLVLHERETSMDYWVDAITNRGLSILRDDFTGGCKFTGLSNDQMADAIHAVSGGLEISGEEIENTIRRSFLRGYRLEMRQGCTSDDYVMPPEVHQEYPQIELPYFNTPEFFSELREKVLARFEDMLAAEGFTT